LRLPPGSQRNPAILKSGIPAPSNAKSLLKIELHYDDARRTYRGMHALNAKSATIEILRQELTRPLFPKDYGNNISQF
jgi:hypothetical protein